MKLYVTRHGQPAIGELKAGENNDFPPGDYALTATGRKQAAALGAYLKKIGFGGKIISSPYYRTAETADVAAAQCGLHFYLEPRLQEMRFYPEPPCPGLTLEQMRKLFPRLAVDAELVHPWITPGSVEKLESLCQRIDRYLDEILPVLDGDALFVGHGASVQALKWNLMKRCNYAGSEGYNWNCSLSCFELLSGSKAAVHFIAKYDFMPETIITSNLRKFGDPACQPANYPA